MIMNAIVFIPARPRRSMSVDRLRGWKSARVLCAIVALITVVAFAYSPALAADAKIDYERDVKPILKARCYGCHGALKQESGLRLDSGGLIREGGEGGPAAVAGNVGESPLVERIAETDESLRMPPEGKPLTAAQIELITAWIAAGAVSPEYEQPEEDPREHWAFKKPHRPQLPSIENEAWVRNPVDAFIAAEHERLGLVPLPPAEMHVLLRRVYLDLIGLPPTREQLKAFLADDSPTAYEDVVDGLLASQHYGERWGRHWMDVWRYSDWYGRRQVNDVRNSYPHIWRWRDWIIRSLNDDKGYDQMIREMLAADEIAPDDDTRTPALGFIVRNWFSLNYDTWKTDLVEHTGKAFLGIRLNCAHCHDHKYDPITQEEYFQFRAFFEPVELRHDRVAGGPPLDKFIRYKPGSGSALKPIEAGLARVYDHDLQAETHMYRLGDARDKMERPPVDPGVPEIVSVGALDVKPIELPPVAWYPGLKPFTQQTEIAKRLAAFELAQKTAAEAATRTASLKQQLDDAQRELDELQDKRGEDGSEPASPRTNDNLIAYWRFEGADDETGFLADSSGNAHTLARVTGTDAPATSTALGSRGRGGAFLDAVPSAGNANLQAADFQQMQSFAYLASAGHPDFYANEFTLEAYLHFDVSSPDFNRTIADYEGCWTLLHRGIDAGTFELRLLFSNADGQSRDVATGSGEKTLILKTGIDYYVCLVMDATHATLLAANLTEAGALRSVRFARHADGADISTLAKPDPATRFKIGNSDGTGRVDGLIDEVRYTRGVLARDEIAAAAAGNPVDSAFRKATAQLANVMQQLKSAEAELNVRELQNTHARAELAAIRARIAADNTRYGGAARSADDLVALAVQAEQSAKLAAGRAQLVLAERTLVDLDNSGKADDKKFMQAQTDAESARKMIAATESESKADYTPLGPQYPKTSTGRRRALAGWIVSRENPLTARVAVNHIWMRHFGRPLVDSVFDFGRGGDRPTHPELLDWLAFELMNPRTALSESTRSGWGMKHIHRLIVTSASYRTASHHPSAEKANLDIDRDNRSWWKFERRRLEAEIVRDNMLHVSGLLDRTIGGQEIDPKLESESYRRSLYFAVYPEAGGAMPFMTMFDAPDPCDCYRRSESIVPQQALAMSNSNLALNVGRHLAARLTTSIAADDVETGEVAFIDAAFEQVLCRKPTPEEQQACNEFLANQRTMFESIDAGALKAAADKSIRPASTEPRQRARESLLRVLLSHNDFVTVH